MSRLETILAIHHRCKRSYDLRPSPSPPKRPALTPPSLPLEPVMTEQQARFLGQTHGYPAVAPVTQATAPVHIDVGGLMYTSTLATLTRCEGSRLAKMFNGTIPIVLDGLKQHYFIDRDGKAFRHILNFLRYNKLALPHGYKELAILEEEARYYEIEDLLREVSALRQVDDPTNRPPSHPDPAQRT